MGLKESLQTREIVELVGKHSWKLGRHSVIEQGLGWYDTHPADVERIRANMEHMGLDCSPQAVKRTLQGIIAHYYEKLFVMAKEYEAHWMIENRVDLSPAGAILERIRDDQRQGRGVFLGQSHFGGTYLLVAILMTHGFDVTFVALFPGPVFHLLKANIDRYADRWKTGHATLVNVADDSAAVPEIMIGALGSGEIVMNVFDENNAFSRPVNLLGRTIHGGSGMDRILQRFGPDRVSIYTPFVVRASDESFRLEMDPHDPGSPDLIQGMFDSLGRRISTHPDQWYFLQELHHSLSPAR